MRRLGLVMTLLVGVSWTAACHEEGDVKVASLSFEGVHAFKASALRAVLVTKTNGPFPWSPGAYFNRAAFEADLVRIREFYVDRGFPEARIAGVEVSLNERGDQVRLKVVVAEGEPVVVSSVQVRGANALPDALQRQIAGVSLEVGRPRSRVDVTAARQRLREILHDNGFAYGEVAVSESESSPKSVAVVFSLTPGPETVFGAISFQGLSSIDERILRRQLSFRPGQTYRERQVIESQRRLGTFELLQFVNVDARPPEDASTHAIPVTVTVAESPPRRLQVGAGYGSEDRLRASAEWSHLNVFGHADRFTSEARWSSLDRGVRIGLARPSLYRRGLSLDVSASTWWNYEPVYTSRTSGGRIGVTYRPVSAGRGRGRPTGDVIKAAYVHEFLRYEIPPTTLGDQTSAALLIALGFNPLSASGAGTKTAVALDYQRSVTDQPQNPRRGYGLGAHLEYARPWLGGTFRYTEYAGEARTYVPLGSRLVMEGRVRAGRLVAERDEDVPFSERYFLGGATSLRGWGRYQVAPLADGLPVGGRTTFDATFETRLSFGSRVGVAVFSDVGNVWSGHPSIDFDALRRDVGFGLRYLTPVGLIRGDLGFQINPIDGLRIDGNPETRHWRLHLSIGPSF